jgi:hypothetical protein
MRQCLAEFPRGNYGNPFAFSGESAAFPMRHSRAIDCVARGVNNGTNGGFTSGGVNIAFVKDIEVTGCTFVDCSGICYTDTGTTEDVRLNRNTAKRAWDGIALVQAKPRDTKSNIEIINNNITIQRRISGAYQGIRLGGTAATNVILCGNRITKVAGGIGGGLDQPWGIMASGTIINGICINNVVDDLNNRFTGTGVFRSGNRQPSGARLTYDTTLADTEDP